MGELASQHQGSRRARRQGARPAVALLASGAAVALVGAATAPAFAASSHGAATKSTLSIAVIAPFTGSSAELGVLIDSPCKADVPLINRNGGVLGHKLACDTIDDYGDPADAVPSVERAFATNHHIVAAVGLETNTAATVIPLVERQHIPFFTAAGLVSYDHQHNPYFYRMSPSDDQNGAAYSVAADRLRYKKVAVVYANDIGASGNIPGTLSAVRKLHMKMTENLVIPGDQSSYSSTVQRIVASKPQALIFYADPQTSATFLTNYSSLTGGKLPPMVTAAANATPDFLSALTKVVPESYITKDIYFVGQALSPKLAAYKTYASSMIASGAPHGTLAAGVVAAQYDGLNIMALAMIKADSTNPVVYNKDILPITEQQPGAVVVHNFAEGARALRAGKNIEYVGTGGVIKFNTYHNFVGSWTVEQLTVADNPTQRFLIPGTTVLANAS